MTTETLTPLNDVDWLFKYRNSHRDFLQDCVWTLDQTDKLNPIKKYPSCEEKPYLYLLADQIVKEPLLACVKHRRMVMTWTACAIVTWDAMFNEGRLNAVISKKEDDSDDLVKRCFFIYQNIPRTLMPRKPLAKYTYTKLIFPEIDSIIRGFAQGPDQLRQHTCSRILADEIAFWPDAEDTFVAMKPTLEGGGKVLLLSTRFPGFFQKIIEDRLEDPS